MSDGQSLPLTFTNPETGKVTEIGTAQIVDTPKGKMILATIGHVQYESLIESDHVNGFSITSNYTKETTKGEN